MEKYKAGKFGESEPLHARQGEQSQWTCGLMMQRFSACTLWALGLLAYSAPALAYIDPGTGSALFYVVTGVVLSAYFAVRSLYYRAIDLLFSLRRLDQKCEIAIHCEDPRYESTFIPVLRSLCGRGLGVTLFTMYPRDASYASLPDSVAHREIPPGIMGYAYLNNIEAILLATTTPQLDVMTFRRSRRVRHYVMVQHALGESRYVRPYAYDYFDSVLCCGPVLKQNIRKMETIREASPKRLYETGLPHYGVLRASAQRLPVPSDMPVVLVAPSWGPLSMFEVFGVGFVANIAQCYRVIVRPHPQMKISQTDLYERILALEGVEVDTGRTPEKSMARANILLSDISGIAHEFAFIHERPVLIIDQKECVGGLEGEVLGGASELRRLCADFIVPIPPTEMPNILIHLKRTMAGHSALHLTVVRDQLVYNFDTASEVAASQLEEIYRQEKTLAGGAKSVRRW